MTGSRTTSNDLFAAVASFFVPGLGQFLCGNGARGAALFGGALVVWWLPSVLVGLHLSVLGSGDPISEEEAHNVMAPFAWAVRLIYHSGAAYDALGALQGKERRPGRPGLRPPQGERRRGLRPGGRART